MSRDALNRRSRWAPPCPTLRRLVLTEADYLAFEAIDRHGPLPTHFLFEFVKHLRRDYSHFQNRLTEFYNGDCAGQYLIRPPQQFAGFEARYQHLVYDLAPRARDALRSRGILTRFSPRRTDPFLHRLMGACVGASMERSALDHGLRYIPREEILARPSCTAVSLSPANPLAVPLGVGNGSRLIPDDLFGLHYPHAGYRFFAVEIDRNTESIERRNLAQTAFGRKITAYIELLRERQYREWWGVPTLSVLTVTTNATHAAHLVDFIRRLELKAFADRFAFNVEPAFGSDWRVPKAMLRHLLDHQWMTVSGKKCIRAA